MRIEYRAEREIARARLDLSYGCSVALFRKPSCAQSGSHLSRYQRSQKPSQTCFEGPFGEVLRVTGPMAKATPFRFSTKYQDDETDLLYYGYRYYNASTGRWVSADPSEESGGLNIYAPNGNDFLTQVDPLGLSSCDITKFYLGGFWGVDLTSPKVQTAYIIVVKIAWLCTDCSKSCCKVERLVKLQASRNGRRIPYSKTGVPLDPFYHPEDPQDLLPEDHCVYLAGDTPGFQNPPILKSGDKISLTGTFRIRVRDTCNGNKLVLDEALPFSASGTYPNGLTLNPPGQSHRGDPTVLLQ
jgi:RHS repeat-associated protein